MSFGRTTNILYLLTYLLTSASACVVANAYMKLNCTLQVLPQWRDYSVHLHKCQLLYRQYRMQDKTLDVHKFLRFILKQWSMTLNS